ncbi:peptidyl-prolyl cis-trans isomerase-like 2 [Melitaea cinxia]|uniref:peptidyl-prolyl cis-trans isomerase-like 2 n=1 Tax=Melitaea cinxia TaxID=113334 RepID=UPI001E270BB9|nr:peptidyl-prolyl cis-trans isomerase-like 2 [Melitaea cinxia]
MHPLRERACDELLEHPLLRTPPPEPERPRPPRVRKPREFKLPPRFPLLSKDFYATWCNHQKELQMAKHKVDDHPPELFPELYLKPRRLDYYARQLEENMNVNKELLKRINLIQRTGGFVDCWMYPEPTDTYNKLLCQQRQRVLDEIRKQNHYLYSRLLIARSEQPLTKELEELWKDTKHKLILGASLPFILFKTEKIDRDIKDPAFDKPPNIQRTKVSMEIWVAGGSKIGRVTIELFTDIVPKTCQLFMTLIKGDPKGHAYMGTRIFRVVPNLYCRGGDVTKDNGFGTYIPDNLTDPIGPENFRLNHTVPGVLSMVVTSDNEVYGQFNIIFKPLPQFDGNHVVFGRIIAGPTQALERISALGLPLGATSSDCVVRGCGWLTRSGQYREGNPNTIKFPPRRKIKK